MLNSNVTLNQDLYFTRGTTQSYIISFFDPDDAEHQLSTENFEDVRITIKQFENTLIRKSTKEGTAILNPNWTVELDLSQEETLRFQPGTAYLQPHILTKDGQAYADKDIIPIKVYDILDGGTI